MLLGFISLLLTVGQGVISQICISEAVAATWHPCSKQQESKYASKSKYGVEEDHTGRRLLEFPDSDESSRRILAATGYDKCGTVGSIIVLLRS